MRKTFFILFVVFINSFSYAQGYELKFKIEDLADTVVYLGHYYGESTYVKDTASVDSEGNFVFKKDKRLESGMYFLVLDKVKIFDFVIGKNQKFEVYTKNEDYINNFKVFDDLENELFFKQIVFNKESRENAEPFIKIVKDSTASEEEVEEAKKQLSIINQKVYDKQNEIIEKYPDFLVSKLFMMVRDIEIPDSLNYDRNSKYSYYKNHFFDNVDLGDSVFLRINEPIYKNRLDNYFDNMVIQDPDSIFQEILKLSEKAKKTQDTYKYFVWTLTLKYQNPEIMGLDKVFVLLIDQFFKSGEMDYWVNQQMMDNLVERSDQLRLSLIGNKAPNMTMMDQNNQLKSLYSIKNKYTIIYFFDPDCGHCRKSTPVLKNFYDSTKLDVGIFAVSTDTSMQKMRDYITEFNMNWITVNGPRTATGPYHESYDAKTTPTLYILDKKRKIIAKKIPASSLQEFLDRYERFQASEIED